jgi:tetratricopeptide (TPR) repeat protein
MGDYGRAEQLLTESVAIQRALGERQVAIVALGNLGTVYLHYGDHERAVSLFREFLARNRALGDKRNSAHALRNLGRAALQQGDLAEARARFLEGLALARELSDRPGIVRLLACWSLLAAERAAWPLVARLAGAVTAQLEAGGVNITPDEVAAFERVIGRPVTPCPGHLGSRVRCRARSPAGRSCGLGAARRGPPGHRLAPLCPQTAEPLALPLRFRVTLW